MSVLIKGMEMPKNCDECFFVGRGFPDWCSLPQIPKDEDEIDDTNNRPDWCPLEEVQETHDKRTETNACDLISRQAAIDAHFEYCNRHPDAGFPVWSLKILEDLPTAQHEQTKMIKEIRKWINSGNRGSADYFIVDKIEEIINKYE